LRPIDLSRAKGDEPSKRIVGRDAHGDPIAGNDLDPKTPHAAAQLSQHFVARVAFDPIKASTMDRQHDAVEVNQVISAHLRESFS
jgi:hypothetical protein